MLKSYSQRKKIIVTGGSSGIGQEICKELASKNYIVINFDKRKYISNNVFFIKTDLSNFVSIQRSFKKMINKNDNLYGLVNNAAITLPNNFLKYSIKDWKRSFQINVSAPFFLSKIFSKHLIKKRNEGCIINITSIGAELAFPENPGYQASKAALKHLTKSMAYDLSKYKIRVNNVVPGYTRGGMNTKSWINKKKRDVRSQRSLSNRWAEPKEIASAVIYLLNDESRFINATDLIVDGGWLSKGL